MMFTQGPSSGSVHAVIWGLVRLYDSIVWVLLLVDVVLYVLVCRAYADWNTTAIGHFRRRLQPWSAVSSIVCLRETSRIYTIEQESYV